MAAGEVALLSDGPHAALALEAAELKGLERQGREPGGKLGFLRRGKKFGLIAEPLGQAGPGLGVEQGGLTDERHGSHVVREPALREPSGIAARPHGRWTHERRAASPDPTGISMASDRCPAAKVQVRAVREALRGPAHPAQLVATAELPRVDMRTDRELACAAGAGAGRSDAV